jgi:hypothetical protein
MVTRDSYQGAAVKACESVLIELVHVLGEFQDYIVVVGGWVPSLLFRNASEPHAGTLDIDLAVDLRRIPAETYQTILSALVSRGYRQDTNQPFRFFREVADRGGRTITVEVDLLASEYGGTGRGHRTQRIQDVQARKARGADLAFDNAVSIPLEGELPGGGRDRVTVRVAGLVPLLVMKGTALSDRVKEKDAYDIYYCVRNYPGGPAALAELFRPHLGNRIVREGLGKIRAKFKSPDYVGPKWVTDFEGVIDEEARAIAQRESYEEVSRWLDALGVESWEGK